MSLVENFSGVIKSWRASSYGVFDFAKIIRQTRRVSSYGVLDLAKTTRNIHVS